jgi:hypothetical protein
LGVYPHRKFHIDLVPGAIAKHARPFSCIYDTPACLQKGMTSLSGDECLITARCKQIGLTNIYHSPQKMADSIG